MNRKKLVFSSIVGLLLLSSTSVVGAAPVSMNDSSAIETNAVVQQTGRQVVAYNKLYYPTRSSLPTQYYYNYGGYAGWIPMTYVTSYSDGAGDWWSVTYEGPVSPVE
ncbi:PAS sensor protein [Paenibacillus faecalis]|uniref:PAS sensor protein n=1 Tax=Paenibacillus faecalis TaxID=2079532 RepID=UPI000D1099AF|nr:PAS sensor protein [Paenibacillus faecalis]